MAIDKGDGIGYREGNQDWLDRVLSSIKLSQINALFTIRLLGFAKSYIYIYIYMYI